MSEHSFLSLAASREVAVRALKVALVVGTILTLINHGDRLFTWEVTPRDFLKIVLCYMVPYCVSTWSAVGTMRALAVFGKTISK